MTHDEENHVNCCMKTEHVVPHAGKRHAFYKTAGLPHEKRRLFSRTTRADMRVTSGSADTGAAKKVMKTDEGHHGILACRHNTSFRMPIKNMRMTRQLNYHTQAKRVRSSPDKTCAKLA